MPEQMKATKKKAKSTVFENSDFSKRRKIMNENTDQVEIPDFSDLMNSNFSNTCERINEEIDHFDISDSIDFSNHVHLFSKKYTKLIHGIYKTGVYFLLLFLLVLYLTFK